MAPAAAQVALPDGVRVVEAADCEPVSQVLARAFHGDPFHRWLFPSEREWARGSARSFRALLRESLEGRTQYTTDGLQGAAIWTPPDAPRPGPLETIRLSLSLLPPFGRRVGRVMRAFGRIQRHQPREPHWYLGVIGTDPVHQGKGVGASLLAPVLRACDAAGVPAWLEASREENVPYYKRFGFQVTRIVEMPGDGPPVWGMRYEPRA